MASTKLGDHVSPKDHDTRVTKSHPAQDGIEQIKAHEEIIQSAKAGAMKEQNMTLLQGIKLYPKAILWSMLISTCIVMEGFDMALVNTMCLSRFSSFLLSLGLS
jgi:hypothetical protein